MFGADISIRRLTQRRPIVSRSIIALGGQSSPACRRLGRMTLELAAAIGPECEWCEVVPYWACAQTEPQRESAAQHFLQLGGYTVYLPRLHVIRLRRRRKVTVTPALFPS